MPLASYSWYSHLLIYAEEKELYVQDLFGGADLDYRLSTRVYTEYAWHSLVIQNLLIEVKEEEKSEFNPEFIIIDIPSFKADISRHGCSSETLIAVNFEKKLVMNEKVCWQQIYSIPTCTGQQESSSLRMETFTW